MKRWVPAAIYDDVVFLSSTCLASAWMDMMQGYVGDSQTTIILKNEMFQGLQKQLRNVDAASNDTTLMSILHLLAGGIWNSNEKTLRVHMHSVVLFITQHGGLERLYTSNQVLADVAVR
jgi:hypothetical protein